jgi:hypothetical protein
LILKSAPDADVNSVEKKTLMGWRVCKMAIAAAKAKNQGK